MAVFSGSDLKVWREMKKITAVELAERISCDVTTVYRYESEKLKPNPDVMYQICYELGDVDRWMDWMRTEYPTSYGRVHPDIESYDLTGSIMSLFAISNEMIEVLMNVMKDAADGKIDDKPTEDRLKEELASIVGRGQSLLNLLNRKK
jgi:transcriptional regulator with XRE-family HTH domain